MLGEDSIGRFTNTLIVSDLDGTLLNTRQQISEENKSAINYFKKHGGKFTIATGRMESSVQVFIDLLEIEMPVILYNGAVIYDPITNKRLFETFLPGYVKIINELRKLNFHDTLGMLAYQDKKVFAVNNNSIIEEYARKDKVICQSIEFLDQKKPVTKLLLISNEKSVLQQCERIINYYNLPCGLVYSESNYLEVLPPNISKGVALKKLQKIININNSLQTLCVGDNLNDVSMLENATMGFVVENCHESMKNKGFYQIIHHEEHAIAYLINQYITRINI